MNHEYIGVNRYFSGDDGGEEMLPVKVCKNCFAEENETTSCGERQRLSKLAEETLKKYVAREKEHEEENTARHTQYVELMRSGRNPF